MKVWFQNNYGTLVSVAIMVSDTDDCGNYGNWFVQGWWNIEPGGSAHVCNTTNSYMCFYAEAANGAQWTGPYTVYVSNEAFGLCLDIANTQEYNVGMQLLHLTGWVGIH